MGCEINLMPVFQIQYTVDCKKNIEIPLAALPKQYIDGRVMAGKVPRCSIEYGMRENSGGYGDIIKIKRIPFLGDLCVKVPRSRAERDKLCSSVESNNNPAYSLSPEAIVQWLASRRLKAAGIRGAVPDIYDIFQYAGETRFTMDFIQGMNVVDAVTSAADPDSLWLQILGQVSLILGYLEETLHLDHRDLKADNLWVCPMPIDYSLTVGGVKWRLQAPFQVVIMDFGFACIGDKGGNAVISLSDGILPSIDPCPKEGRDLFQLIASTWSIPAIRMRAGEEVQAVMESLLVHKQASYYNLVQRNLQTHWIYLAVSDIAFRHPPLHPLTLLLKLNRDWKVVKLYQE